LVTAWSIKGDEVDWIGWSGCYRQPAIHDNGYTEPSGATPAEEYFLLAAVARGPALAAELTRVVSRFFRVNQLGDVVMSS
jgi:hypothetical protein